MTLKAVIKGIPRCYMREEGEAGGESVVGAGVLEAVNQKKERKTDEIRKDGRKLLTLSKRRTNQRGEDRGDQRKEWGI